MIQVKGLVKSFGAQFALRGIDLEIASGESVTLVGPNGAGKTTMLRILAGLSQPTQGQVSIAGVDVSGASDDARRAIGFLSHQPLLYEDLSAEENLAFYGRMYNVGGLARRIDQLLVQVGLAHRRSSLVRTFSRGMKQRLAIARALVHDPSVLLLDEPFSGLDQQAKEMLVGLLHEMGLGSRTVVLTTHDLEQGLGLCRRAILLVDGGIRAEGESGRQGLDHFREEYRRAFSFHGET